MVSGFWLPCNNEHVRKVGGLGDVQKATNSLLSFFGILLLTVMFHQKSVSFQPLTFILLLLFFFFYFSQFLPSDFHITSFLS